MAAAKLELTPAQRSRRTLGLFLLVFVGPLLALRGACVSYGEVCGRVGGHYGEVAGVTRVCRMPEGRACPRPFRWSERGGGCTARGVLPVIWRWSAW